MNERYYYGIHNVLEWQNILDIFFKVPHKALAMAMARQSFNIFGRPTVEPKDISTASVRDLCLFIRGAGLLRLC